MTSLAHLTPRCHLCGCPLEVCEDECYCPCCTAFGIPEDGPAPRPQGDPAVEEQRAAWRAATGEDIVTPHG
jgi:hypothetical protein